MAAAVPGQTPRLLLNFQSKLGGRVTNAQTSLHYLTPTTPTSPVPQEHTLIQGSRLFTEEELLVIL